MKKHIEYENIREHKLMSKTLSLEDAIKESSRCLLCEDAPCSKGCPASTDPAKFIRQIKFENYKGAARTIRNNNVFGYACSFTCPVDKLCEKECVSNALDEPINISGLQRFACEYGKNVGLEPLQKAPATGPKVAVVGAGPAGMSCAAELAKKGCDVTVFEREKKSGGIAAWMIPSYRLNNEAIDHAESCLKELGVNFVFGHALDGDDAIKDLFNKGYKACFISTGLSASAELEFLKGYENVVMAKDFLRSVKFRENAPKLKDKNVVVIGGGSVAMDAAVTAKSLGAKKVYAVSLEALSELPADAGEVMLARGVNVIFRSNSQITDVIASQKIVTGLKGVEIEWKEQGNFSPANARKIEGTEFNVRADYVIEAIGQIAGHEIKKIASGLTQKTRGTISVNDDFETSVPGVFAGGDVSNGGASIARAVGDGKKAAESIIKFVGRRSSVVVCNQEPFDSAHGKQPTTDDRQPTKYNLAVKFLGVKCENPFFLSSSPVSNTAEMCERAFEFGWGGVVYKTLGLENKFKVIMPSPRLSAMHYEDKRFVMLQNAEQITDRPIKDNIADIMHIKKRFPKRVLVSSIMGYEDEDWALLAKMSEDAGADMLELNFSCPQMARKDAGHRVGQSYEAVSHFTSVVKKASRLPVIAKMTPNITDMIPVALAAKEGGADAISAINTIRGITDVDIENFIPTPTIHGRSAITGCSGPAAKPIALRFVSELYNSRELGLPISGIGGVTTWKDALKFILCGASNVQVTTSIMRYGYRIVEDMIEGLGDFLNAKGVSSLSEIIGKAAEKLIDPSELNNRYQVVSKIDEDKCIGCGQCYISCRDGAHDAIKFDSVKRKAAVDEEKCVGCLLCKHICPVWDCVSHKEIDTATTQHAGVI